MIELLIYVNAFVAGLVIGLALGITRKKR